MERIDAGARRAEARARPADAEGRRGRRSAGDAASAPAGEHKRAFEAYVRRGDDAALRGSKEGAVGRLARTAATWCRRDRDRDRQAASPLSPIRAHRRRCGQVSGAVYKKPFMTTGPAVGWVGETAARPQTATPTLAELQFPAMELYAMPAATATLLEDTRRQHRRVDRRARWRRPSPSRRARPSSPATAPTSRRASSPIPRWPRRAGAGASIGYVATGVAGALPASDPSDVLIDPIYALKAGYRQNAHFVMNRKTQAAVRKFKDADGNYLWQPPAAGGQQATLMGFPLVEAEDMPDIAAERDVDRVRRFPPRLSGGRPARRARAARSRTPPSPTCCSTRPSASAAACRTSTRSS